MGGHIEGKEGGAHGKTQREHAKTRPAHGGPFGDGEGWSIF